MADLRKLCGGPFDGGQVRSDEAVILLPVEDAPRFARYDREESGCYRYRETYDESELERAKD